MSIAVRASWTENDDARLRAAVKQHGTKKWDLITKTVGNKTKPQCCCRWQTLKYPDVKLGAWTKEEDDLFLKAIEKVGEDWNLVHQEVKNRSPSQCYKRWNTLKVKSRSVHKWSETEEKNLSKAILQHGQGKWKAISDMVKTRTAVQCRNHWQTQQVESLKRGAWMSEELESLKRAVNKHGTGCWLNISKEMKTRSASSCLSKWLQIKAQVTQ